MSRGSKKDFPSDVPAVSTITRVNVALLAVIHVVSALLFFTNLTRNPYYTQIALLNAGIALVVGLWAIDAWLKGAWLLPRFSFEAPLAAFLLVAAVSSVSSWARHDTLRSGIFYENMRVWSFTLVNSVMALYLPGLFLKSVGTEPRRLSIWSDILFALLWSGLWLGFHANKDTDPTALIWDSYGGILWVMALVYAVVRTRRGEMLEFLHLILAVSLVAAIYGILQYFGKDIIWSSPIQPYGGRPVSSFGNPNFLSSYVMLVSPVAFALGLSARGGDRFGYFGIAIVNAVCVLCTLTRSSYLGFIACYAVMGLLLIRFNAKVVFQSVGVAVAIFLILVLLFPKTPISAVQSPLLRFTEIFDAMKSGQPYGPWHQRILIWSSAWDMLQQNKALGIGWGSFELFYPFFQGKYMFAPVLSLFRTHANNAHNILMEIWAQVGLVGTGMALWLLVTMTVSGWKIFRRSEGAARFLTASLVGGLVGMVTDNFFGNVSIFFATPAFLFWWNMGVLYGELPETTAETVSLTGIKARAALAGVGLVCAATFVYYVKRWNQEVHYFAGFKEAKIGDISKSVKELDAAYRWFAGEVNSNYEWGNSSSRLAHDLSVKGLNDEAKKYNEKAIEGFKAALAANPGYDEIYFNLGVTQMQMGQPQEAIRNLEMAMYINPLLKEVYGALGKAYIDVKDLENARRVFDQATQAFPADKDYWNNLGFVLSQMKRDEEAFAVYKKAVTIDPSFTQGWQNLAVSARTLKKMDDPLLQVPGLIQGMEQNIARKDYKSALGFAQRIADTLPENSDAQLSLGNLYFYLGKYDDSEKHFNRAVELNPRFVIAHVNMGKLFLTQGKNDLARKQFETVLSLDPTNEEAKSALASLPK